MLLKHDEICYSVYKKKGTRARRGLHLKEYKAEASEGDSDTLILFYYNLYNKYKKSLYSEPLDHLHGQLL